MLSIFFRTEGHSVSQRFVLCVIFLFQFLNQFSDFNETWYERWAVRGQSNVFLGAFAKLRKATVSFVMSVRPHGTTRLPMGGFS